MTQSDNLRGRQAEARRNDTLVLESALVVLSEDPAAPMSAVAARAGVGQATLYRRYASKDELMVAVCRQGLGSIADAVRRALDDPDPWHGLTGFLSWYAESQTLRMGALLGAFDPPEDLFAIAHRTNVDMQALVDRAAAAGALRRDVTGADLSLLVTQLGSLPDTDAERGAQLRCRYLTLALQGLALTGASELPGPAPDGDELERPWQERRQQAAPRQR